LGLWIETEEEEIREKENVNKENGGKKRKDRKK
jgi:hypothetical protein